MVVSTGRELCLEISYPLPTEWPSSRNPLLNAARLAWELISTLQPVLRMTSLTMAPTFRFQAPNI